MSDESFVFFGTLLIIAGAILALIAVSLPALLGRGKTQGGAVVIIGPFPIVFGSNRQIARSLLILATLLVVSLMAFFLMQQFLLAPS